MNLVIKNGECNHAKIHHYPDGQKNITLDMEYFNNVKEPVELVCSIRNFSDIEILMCVVHALRKNDFWIMSCHFVYLFGMRSDRAFETGMPNYFHDVLAPIINSFEIDQVTFLQPHSFLSLRCINNTHVNNMLVETALSSPDMIHSYKVGGDASFMKWGYELNGNFVKQRIGDEVKTVLPRKTIHELKDYTQSITIVDDLCDGGASFIAGAKHLQENFPGATLNLFVVHGLFTKGVAELLKYFHRIYCTNSYQDIDHPKIKQFKVI